jgi:serine/threonine-protein phosphatase PPG1
MTLLSLLKLRYPERVSLIRGNHETKGITQNYGFYMECQTKFNNTLVWEYFTDMFDYMPIGALINDDIFCVHGGFKYKNSFQISLNLGLSPFLETTFEIMNLDRFQEIPQDGAFTDLVWSDPDSEKNGFTISPRFIRNFYL